ncbi:MAG TPA: LpqB family beta-propeller domain-containing protein [Thermoanaerobaculia bacterium]|nr:LpqB family beta-propeller domain-containing protein [Thermoanaerobaculia bacterium]
MPSSASLAVSLALLAAPLAAAPRPVTVADLMALRSIVDVRISPDGRQVAYVVSTPSFEKAEHEAALWLVPAAGGAPVRLTWGTRIFNKPRPVPRLRWSPDGTRLSFLAFAGEQPQVFALDVRGGEARALTASPQGVGDYAWSPDGARLAYLAQDAPSAEEEKRRKEKSFVVQVDRQDRPPRLWVQDLAGGGARALSPPEHFVAGLDWSPDGASVAYAAALRPGFVGQFHTRIYAVPAPGGAPRVVVDRDGMNTSPQWSPDGRWIGFVSSDGRPEMVSAWGLHLAPAEGGDPRRIRSLTPDSWVAEFTWAPDSGSLLAVTAMSPAQRGARMFEQPLLRLWLDGRQDELDPGPYVHFAPSLSRDGRRLAFRSVAALTMGDVFVLDLDARDGGRPRRLTEINPELAELALGKLEPISWTSSAGGMEIWGLLLTPPGAAPARRLPLGLPWEAPAAYAEHSALTYVTRVTTPLLIQHGENDRRVPIAGATKFYRALRDQGKVVEMEIYPRGGHVIYEPALEQEIMRRNLEWFRRWLKP